MSIETEAILRAAAACSREIEGLKCRAIHGGNIIAAKALVDVAIEATRAVHAMWFEPSVFNPFENGRTARDGVGARREMLAWRIGTEREFPVLHSWDVPRVRGLLEAQQQEILHSLQFGPMKGPGRKQSRMRMLVELIIVPVFDEIRMGSLPQGELERRIWGLPPLAVETRSEWAKAAVDWVWSRPNARRRLQTKGADLYALARPERELDRDRRKAEKRLDVRTAQWKKSDGWPLGVVNAAKREMRRAEIRKMKVTDAHVRSGLRTEICVYLHRHLRRLASDGNGT